MAGTRRHTLRVHRRGMMSWGPWEQLMLRSNMLLLVPTAAASSE